MPQPFEFRGGPLLTRSAALEARPSLAMQIVRVCDEWNWLEQSMAVLFLTAVAGRQDAALAIFSEIIDRRLRAMALEAAITASKPQVLAKARELNSKIAKLSARRNLIVHGIWAAMPSRPDSLLLYDQKQRIAAIYKMDKDMEERANLLTDYAAGKITSSYQTTRSEELRDQAMIAAEITFNEYKKHDFEPSSPT